MSAALASPAPGRSSGPASICDGCAGCGAYGPGRPGAQGKPGIRTRMSSWCDTDAMVVSVEPNYNSREAAMTAMTDFAIRSFEVHMPEENLVDLWRRIA